MRKILPVILLVLPLGWFVLAEENRVTKQQPKLPSSEEVQTQALGQMLDTILLLDRQIEKEPKLLNNQILLLSGLGNLVCGHNNMLVSKMRGAKEPELGLLMRDSKATSELSAKISALQKERLPRAFQD